MAAACTTSACTKSATTPRTNDQGCNASRSVPCLLFPVSCRIPARSNSSADAGANTFQRSLKFLQHAGAFGDALTAAVQLCQIVGSRGVHVASRGQLVFSHLDLLGEPCPLAVDGSLLLGDGRKLLGEPRFCGGDVGKLLLMLLDRLTGRGEACFARFDMAGQCGRTL